MSRRNPWSLIGLVLLCGCVSQSERAPAPEWRLEERAPRYVDIADYLPLRDDEPLYFAPESFPWQPPQTPIVVHTSRSSLAYEDAMISAQRSREAFLIRFHMRWTRERMSYEELMRIRRAQGGVWMAVDLPELRFDGALHFYEHTSVSPRVEAWKIWRPHPEVRVDFIEGDNLRFVLMKAYNSPHTLTPSLPFFPQGEPQVSARWLDMLHRHALSYDEAAEVDVYVWFPEVGRLEKVSVPLWFVHVGVGDDRYLHGDVEVGLTSQE